MGPVVGGTVAAAGGLGLGIRTDRTGRAAFSARGGGGRTVAAHVAGVGKALAGLGAFAQTLQRDGLDAAVGRLGLEQLVGKPAVEVIGAVADHIGDQLDGLDRQILTRALNEALLEAAELADGDAYGNLEVGLQEFLNTDGLKGLVEVFLTRFVADFVCTALEEHAESEARTNGDLESFMAAVEIVCRQEVKALLDEAQVADRLNTVDWFGREGKQFATGIARDITARLESLKDQ